MTPHPVPRLLLIIFVFFAAPAPAVEHTFRFDPTGAHELPESVHVAGTFNGWNKTQIEMQRSGDGVYAATVDLPPGVHQYKFILDGDDWTRDPVYSDAELEQPDGHGGMNSAVLIGPDARDWPAPKPDHINVEGIEHDPGDFTHLNVVSEDLLLLGVTTQAGDVERVVARVLDQNTEEETRHELDLEATELGRDKFVGLVHTTPGPKLYSLIFYDGEMNVWLNSVETDEVIRSDAHGSHKRTVNWSLRVEMKPSFTTPDWAKHAVWYQIFPERFRNGDPRNDPGDAWFENLLPWTADWWATHPEYGELPGAENFYSGGGNVWKRRYGGDLQGVREALPYLRRLGVNALYFNPIFEADSMHKYDASDFRHVDDNFGVKSKTPRNQVEGETDDPATWGWSESDRVFLDFIEEAHAQGFKVVIDGVFNHVGRSHPFFQDVLEHGKESRYADWFEITDWGTPPPENGHGSSRDPDNPRGIRYEAWDGPNGALPVFKNDPATGLADGPRQHIFDITIRWMDPNGDGDPSDGVDGWRLDVPGDIAHPFWIEWRQLVKGVNPDAYISGEIWSWAHPWLKGDQFDAVMNYQFAIPALDFFADDEDAIAPSAFAKRLNRVAYSYPMQVSLVQMNLFDSHDTDRVASMFVNPDRGYDGQNRPHDTGPNYITRKPTAEERKRMMQAAVCQFTFVGAPMIYYGTEAGMWGPDDPSNRMPMVWPGMAFEDPDVEFDEGLFNFYQRLVALRAAQPALRLGAFHPLPTDDDTGVLAYERLLGEERVVVVINRSDRPREIELAVPPGRYVDLLDTDTAAVAYDADAPDPPDAPDARPALVLSADAPALDAAAGRLGLTLRAYGSAVLVPGP